MENRCIRVGLRHRWRHFEWDQYSCVVRILVITPHRDRDRAPRTAYLPVPVPRIESAPAPSSHHTDDDMGTSKASTSAVPQPPAHSDELKVAFPQDHVMLLTLNRPKALNAVSPTMKGDIERVLDWFDSEPSLW